MVDRIIVGPFRTNSYIFSPSRKKGILIDPGADGEAIISRFKTMNLDLVAIVLTHGHLDHLSGATYVQNYFSSYKGKHVPLAIHAQDQSFTGEGAIEYHEEAFTQLSPEGYELADKLSKSVPQADILLEDGDIIFDSDLQVIHTPGHTPGSICLYSVSQKVLFSGDTLFFEGIGRTDMKGGDQNSLLYSIRDRLYDLPREVRVFPGHGPHTTLEREWAHNPFLDYTAKSRN